MPRYKVIHGSVQHHRTIYTKGYGLELTEAEAGPLLLEGVIVKGQGREMAQILDAEPVTAKGKELTRQIKEIKGRWLKHKISYGEFARETSTLQKALDKVEEKARDEASEKVPNKKDKR